METEYLLQCETARREAYKGFADCYYLPDNDLAQKVKSMEYQLRLLGSETLPHVLRMWDVIESPDCLETLQIEFSKLFVGPFTLLAPPYGSVYLEGERKVMGNSTLDVMDRYKGVGLAISETFKDVPDHIAVELEFMYFLVFKCIEAEKRYERSEVDENLNTQKEFLEDHLGNWISDFTKTVSSHAETDFYRNLAIATRVFIGEDMARISNFDL